MTTVYQSGHERVFTLAFQDGEGETVVPIAASYTVADENGEEVVASTVIDVSGSPATTDITVTSLQNTIDAGSIRGFRTLLMIFEDSAGNDYQQKVTYILEEANVMEPGTNAFARFEHFLMMLEEYPEFEQAKAATDRVLMMALINAYYNIGALRVEFPVEDELSDVHTTLDLGSGDLIAMTTATLNKLKRACLTEAESILGGNPVEDRRRMGLMSHSAGESAHFFRPTRPLDLPVSKATARALAPLVSYSLRAGRV